LGDGFAAMVAERSTGSQAERLGQQNGLPMWHGGVVAQQRRPSRISVAFSA
jgi:hypothetical protein